MTQDAVACQLIEDERSLQGLQSKVVEVSDELNKWYVTSKESVDERKASQADVTLQLVLLESTRQFTNEQVLNIKALKERSALEPSESSQLMAKQTKLAIKVISLILQYAAKDTVFKDTRSVAVDCECPAKRANVL